MLGLFLAFLNGNPLTQAHTNTVALDDWTIECIDCPRYFDNLSNRSAVLDSNDLPHVAYGGDHLYYGYLDVGGEWHSEVVDASPRVGFGAALALDSNEHPHILYYDSTNNAFKYASHDGLDWQIEPFPAGSLADPHISVAMDSNDKLHVSFYGDVAGDLIYGMRVGSGWYFEAVDSDENVGKFSSIALDGNDLPHISYRDGTNSQLKYASFNGADWTVQPLTGDGYDTDIAIDQDGYAHIVYHSNNVLMYQFQDTAGWHMEVVDETGFGDLPGTIGRFNSIGLDHEGEPHVSYSSYWSPISPYPYIYSPALAYAHRSSDGWEVEELQSWYVINSTILIHASGKPSFVYKAVEDLAYKSKTDLGWEDFVLDKSEFVGLSSSLDMVFLDQPHISYHDSEGFRVKYAQRNPSGWFVLTIDSAGWKASNRTRLSLSPKGDPHILYAQYGRLGDGLRYAFSIDGAWSHEQIWSISWDTWTNPGAIAFDLVVDLEGHPHAVDRAWLNNKGWIYLYKNEYWTPPETITNSIPYPGQASIAISSSGEIHVALSGDNLLHSVQETSGWFIETIDTGSFNSPSLDIDANGFPRISYYDATNGDLKYAKFNGNTWEVETIDTVGDVGSYSSLGIDFQDRGHIAYYDATNGDLKYAYYNGSEWEISTLVSEGDVGSHCSLVLDPFGNPYISYHDAGLGDLMIIYKPHGTLHQLILPMISR